MYYLNKNKMKNFFEEMTGEYNGTGVFQSGKSIIDSFNVLFAEKRKTIEKLMQLCEVISLQELAKQYREVFFECFRVGISVETKGLLSRDFSKLNWNREFFGKDYNFSNDEKEFVQYLAGFREIGYPAVLPELLGAAQDYRDGESNIKSLCVLQEIRPFWMNFLDKKNLEFFIKCIILTGGIDIEEVPVNFMDFVNKQSQEFIEEVKDLKSPW